MDEYQRLGYKSRMDYLQGLAKDYGLPFSTVRAMAELLGPNEDFDGLVSELEDIESAGDFD